MSYRVLVIPEDPINNGYILKLLAETILTDAGKPQAKVTVLANPRLRGYDDAVRAIREELLDRYGFWDLWLFFPDVDRAKPAPMRDLEDKLLAQKVRLFCCPAQPETEIYCCAAHVEALGMKWEEAQRHPRLKEEVFEPFLNRHGYRNRAGQGRDLLVSEAMKNLSRFYRLCPEIMALRDRIKGHLSNIVL